ncbi:conserved hypothetical protein [Thermosulfidibacter takaii ABI70S6]|uniref:DUF503 domain-containing protein n=1 Tax=Thermosulfidibacter takaii (strain DSM 17441 / JCM 13301 / NBRC 103674 / ABI70S6) TaxID=1298851 RepID=A0A0S3QRF1_THET7|nr:DUF503 domain-containing protein [Thermosulfidibacter takaii]BAT70914.1 conserved hypothetical protein [Thermosulfidibacter takaii ABI70S6]
MVIGSLRVLVEIPGNNSLKGKRRVVKSLMERIKNKFNVSVAEVEHQDEHRLATIGIALVTNDTAFANRVLNQIVNLVDEFGEVVLLDYLIEIV